MRGARFRGWNVSGRAEPTSRGAKEMSSALVVGLCGCPESGTAVQRDWGVPVRPLGDRGSHHRPRRSRMRLLLSPGSRHRGGVLHAEHHYTSQRSGESVPLRGPTERRVLRQKTSTLILQVTPNWVSNYRWLDIWHVACRRCIHSTGNRLHGRCQCCRNGEDGE